MLTRALGVLALGICGSLGLVQPAMAEKEARADHGAEVDPVADERDDRGKGGFFEFLRNLDVQPPDVPRDDRGGDGGGDSGGSGGHN